MNTSYNIEYPIRCYFFAKCIISHKGWITHSNFRTLDGELGSSLLSEAPSEPPKRVEPMTFTPVGATESFISNLYLGHLLNLTQITIPVFVVKHIALYSCNVVL